MKFIVLNNFDVIVVGGGIAGLYATLNLDPKLSVLLICKRELTLCNSSLAQGGIAAVYDKQHDTVGEHFHDTMVAGGFANNPNTVEILATEGSSDVEKLISRYHVDFDKDSKGDYHLTLEGGHTKKRILHYKDCTGKEIIDKLIISVTALPNVTIIQNHMVCDLKKTEDTFHLDVIDSVEPHPNHSYYNSHFVVMCTGGIGRVYEYTTNSSIATGDGITLSHELGARIRNLHLVQFHPTAFANKQTRESFLISESVRGEGAYLLNCNYKRFMQKYDERLELAPRDVVSRSIIEEARITGSNDFFLNISHVDSDYIKTRFPMIYESLLSNGFDLTKDNIPIFPCQHYLMGGIDVNENAKTTIDGLYACGECSHTGVHGNNRLASNSLLEGVVFSRRCAEEINSLAEVCPKPFANYTFKVDHNTKSIRHGIRTEIRSIIQRAHFVTPNIEQARIGYKRICELLEQIKEGDFIVDWDAFEAKSLATICSIIFKEVI